MAENNCTLPYRHWLTIRSSVSLQWKSNRGATMTTKNAPCLQVWLASSYSYSQILYSHYMSLVIALHWTVCLPIWCRILIIILPWQIPKYTSHNKLPSIYDEERSKLRLCPLIVQSELLVLWSCSCNTFSVEDLLRLPHSYDYDAHDLSLFPGHWLVDFG